MIGLTFSIETDHKPLVPLLSAKNLDELPLRVQRFHLRMMRFNYSISHVPGKYLYTAGALSRAPVSTSNSKDHSFRKEVDSYVNLVIGNLPATDARLKEIQSRQEEDPIFIQLKTYCLQGWPEKASLKGPYKAYHAVSNELSVNKNLLLRGNRLVIPSNLRPAILEKLHIGHQGITK